MKNKSPCPICRKPMKRNTVKFLCNSNFFNPSLNVQKDISLTKIVVNYTTAVGVTYNTRVLLNVHTCNDEIYKINYLYSSL